MCRLFDHLNLRCCSSPALFAYLTTLSALTLFSVQPKGMITGGHHQSLAAAAAAVGQKFFHFRSVFMAVSLSISSLVEPRFCCWSQYIHTLIQKPCTVPAK
jgi:hypothetical protein